MRFEEALKIELETIEGLIGKVFPLYAPEEAVAPYIVYKKENIDFTKTLDGTTNEAESKYYFALLSKSYKDLQDKSEAIIDLFISFPERTIGGQDGVYIEDISVKHLGDMYEKETDEVRANFEITVNYTRR